MSIITVIKNNGLIGTALYVLEQKLGFRVPLPPRLRWLVAKKSEASYWDQFFASKGAAWPDDYAYRTDPRAKVTPDVGALLADSETLNILDVGAGPLTILGKVFNGRKLNIRAVDPLADEYDAILERHGITPIVRTEKMAGEELSQHLPVGHFDLVFAQNCIDHSVDPVRSILEMLKVVKPGRYVYLKHSQNEAVKENWVGLHQWNFAEEVGDFMVSSRTTRVNFTRDFAHIAETTCTVDKSIDWVNVKIRKA